MSIYDWSCTLLIHTYVELHYSDWWNQDCSEIEYVDRNFSDFRDWAGYLGYEVDRS